MDKLGNYDSCAGDNEQKICSPFRGALLLVLAFLALTSTCTQSPCAAQPLKFKVVEGHNPDKLPATPPTTPPRDELTPLHLPPSSKATPGRAQNTELPPLQPTLTPEESFGIANTMSEAESKQLMDLWNATLNRSQEIQFVLTRLTPQPDEQHRLKTALRQLNQLVFTAVPMSVGGITSPAAKFGTKTGASILGSLFDRKLATKASGQQLTEEHVVGLYRMVKDVADKLTDRYRQYRRLIAKYSQAYGDFLELRATASDAEACNGNGDEALLQLQNHYWLQQARRDILSIQDEVDLQRRFLIDLAGVDAVSALDKQLKDEQVALEQLTGEKCFLGSSDEDKYFHAPRLQRIQLFRPATAIRK